MVKRRVLMAALAALLAGAIGCKAPCPAGAPKPSAKAPAATTAAPAAAAPQAQPAAAAAAPVMEVTLWSGEEITGPVTWREDGTVVVGERSLQSSDIRSMQAADTAAAQAGAVDVAALPEGFRPLDDAALSAYRKRALEAAEKYKGSDTIVCLDYGADILTTDWRQIYRYHALYLILKETGRGVANVAVGYRAGRSRSKVLFARSISPDGYSTWADAGAFTETVPPEAAQFVDTRGRVLSGQVPGAAVDMMIEYAYESELYNPEIKEYFFPGYLFQSDKPVLDSIIDVVLPAGMPINYATHNMPAEAAKPRITKGTGSDVWRWEMYDAPVITAGARHASHGGRRCPNGSVAVLRLGGHNGPDRALPGRAHSRHPRRDRSWPIR